MEVSNLYMHNSISQYIRDIIVAIRLHPQVRRGCSVNSFQAVAISAKFNAFITRLEPHYVNLRNSDKAIDRLLAKISFVRPLDVDKVGVKCLSHRLGLHPSIVMYSKEEVPTETANTTAVDVLQLSAYPSMDPDADDMLLTDSIGRENSERDSKPSLSSHFHAASSGNIGRRHSVRGLNLVAVQRMSGKQLQRRGTQSGRTSPRGRRSSIGSLSKGKAYSSKLLDNLHSAFGKSENTVPRGSTTPGVRTTPRVFRHKSGSMTPAAGMRRTHSQTQTRSRGGARRAPYMKRRDSSADMFGHSSHRSLGGPSSAKKRERGPSSSHERGTHSLSFGLDSMRSIGHETLRHLSEMEREEKYERDRERESEDYTHDSFRGGSSSQFGRGRGLFGDEDDDDVHYSRNSKPSKNSPEESIAARLVRYFITRILFPPK